MSAMACECARPHAAPGFAMSGSARPGSGRQWQRNSHVERATLEDVWLNRADRQAQIARCLTMGEASMYGKGSTCTQPACQGCLCLCVCVHAFYTAKAATTRSARRRCSRPPASSSATASAAASQSCTTMQRGERARVPQGRGSCSSGSSSRASSTLSTACTDQCSAGGSNTMAAQRPCRVLERHQFTSSVKSQLFKCITFVPWQPHARGQRRRRAALWPAKPASCPCGGTRSVGHLAAPARARLRLYAAVYPRVPGLLGPSLAPMACSRAHALAANAAALVLPAPSLVKGASHNPRPAVAAVLVPVPAPVRIAVYYCAAAQLSTVQLQKVQLRGCAARWPASAVLLLAVFRARRCDAGLP